jgi:hypothetical protein
MTVIILAEGNKAELRRFIPEDEWVEIDEAFENDVRLCLCSVPESEALMAVRRDGDMDFNSPKSKL